MHTLKHLKQSGFGCCCCVSYWLKNKNLQPLAHLSSTLLLPPSAAAAATAAVTSTRPPLTYIPLFFYTSLFFTCTQSVCVCVYLSGVKSFRHDLKHNRFSSFFLYPPQQDDDTEARNRFGSTQQTHRSSLSTAPLCLSLCVCE